MHINRILFTTDFSSCAERAFSHASYLATRYDAELHVLHVSSSDGAGGSPLDHYALRPEDEATRSDAYQSQQTEDEIVVIHSQMTAQSPVEGILAYARKHGADLIVMGTHGRTGIDHLLSGSVAEDIVRHATCPVFTVRCTEGAGWREQVKRLLVPIDFSEFTPLPVALELARAYEAEIDLLHVIEEAVLPTIYGVEPLSPGAPLFVQRTTGAIERLLAAESCDGLTIRTHVRIGHPARRILDVAQECESDVIVLSSHGRTGLGRLLMGSVAEKVVRLSTVPVFTVKSNRQRKSTANGRTAATSV